MGHWEDYQTEERKNTAEEDRIVQGIGVRAVTVTVITRHSCLSLVVGCEEISRAKTQQLSLSECISKHSPATHQLGRPNASDE